MTRPPYLNHGREHKPGGSDPIPGMGGGNAEWFYAIRNTDLTMSALGNDTVPWDSLNSSDASLFSLGTNIHTNDSVVVARIGALICSAYCIAKGTEPDFPYRLLLQNLSFGMLGSNTDTPENHWTYKGLPGADTLFGPRDIGLMVTASVPDKITVRYKNEDSGASHVLDQVVMAGFWWPTSVAIT